MAPGKLNDDQQKRYKEDGVVMVRGLLSSDCLQQIERAVTRVLLEPTPMAAIFSKPEDGFHMEAALFMSDDDLKEVVFHSPMAGIAQTLMASRNIHFFYDQMFCKQPGNQIPTPWHHDLSFWPVAGDQICSMWVTLDHVRRESSGLEFVRGSHLWNRTYKAITPMYNEQMMNPEHEEVPDIELNREKYDLLSWEIEPGDMLIFHPKTLHASGGNYHLSQQR